MRAAYSACAAAVSSAVTAISSAVQRVVGGEPQTFASSFQATHRPFGAR
jgi:hypothetical protein